ncbi:flap endonuclease 1-like isoform X2 [Pleurodeles waltl]|uniref:flap endonuclease 1-like isoform X2 n=1 Tax=Pleurodeles waltl TaxID=8319 RepID=UPI0037094062
MGITKLAAVIREAAPEAVSRASLQDYGGRIVAVDTSVAIYQFLTGMPEIHNRNGENISLLQGLFFRTVTLLENGIKPVYVFDGRPPELKQPLLAKRAETAKFSRRSVGAGAISAASSPAEQSGGLDPLLIPDRASEKDCETLLRHLGVPCLQAPGEAEATCAALVASGRAWCTVTEDMDALPFGSTRLVRHLTAGKKGEIEEYSLPIILEKLKLNRRQNLPCPDDWRFEEARALFLQPSVIDDSRVHLEWTEPDEEKLVQFLSHQKHMKEARVRSRMENMRKTQLKKRKALEKMPTPEKRQRTMGEFFSVKKNVKSVSKPQSVDVPQMFLGEKSHSHSPHPSGS